MRNYEAFDWIQKQLETFTYKRGWEFSIQPSIYDDWMTSSLLITFTAEDAYHPGHHIQVRSVNRFPIGVVLNRDAKRFTGWFQHCLFSAEQHESREWFRVNGQIHNDPHK